MAAQFIGQVISLVSKSDVRVSLTLFPSHLPPLPPLATPKLTHPRLVCPRQIRYQGVLHSIDPLQATVSLEKGALLTPSDAAQGRGCPALLRVYSPRRTV